MIDFYRTLTDAQKASYDELKKAFRPHYTEKPVVFRGRLARREKPGGEINRFSRRLTGFSDEGLPG